MVESEQGNGCGDGDDQFVGRQLEMPRLFTKTMRQAFFFVEFASFRLFVSPPTSSHVLSLDSFPTGHRCLQLQSISSCRSKPLCTTHHDHGECCCPRWSRMRHGPKLVGGRVFERPPYPITLLLHAPLRWKQKSCLQFPSSIGSLNTFLLTSDHTIPLFAPINSASSTEGNLSMLRPIYVYLLPRHVCSR